MSCTMIKTSLVLTVLGADRPGIVESLARIVAEHGANWVDSRMAHLAGHFAGILRVEAEADRAEALAAALRQLADAGLESIVHPDASAAAPDVRAACAVGPRGAGSPGHCPRHQPRARFARA